MFSCAYHWWVGLFAGSPSVGNAADTAAYWAQAIGTVAAIFATIFLAAFQYFSERNRQNQTKKQLRDGVRQIAEGIIVVINELTSGRLTAAHQSKDVHFIPQAKRTAREFHGTLTSVPLEDLAKAGLVSSVIRLKKSTLDIEQILEHDDVAISDQPSAVISQLNEVGKNINNILSSIP